MKLKTYIVSALVLALSLIGFTPSTKAQDSNTRAMSCNGCSEATKRQVLKDMIGFGHASGVYRYVVIDMLGGNVHEYEVIVPVSSSYVAVKPTQLATVGLVFRADQATRNQRVADVRDAIEDIENAIGQTFGSSNPVPATDGFVSAYNALEDKKDFDAYVKDLLANTDTVAGKVHEASLFIQMLSDSIQIGFNAVATVSLTLHTPTYTGISFADGSKIEVILTLTKMAGSGDIEITVKARDIAYDKNRDRLPLGKFTLVTHNFGQSEVNQSAIDSYYQSIGMTLLFGSSWTNGGSCDTKWTCMADGKTCELQIITDSC